MIQEESAKGDRRDRCVVTQEEVVRCICDFLDVHGYHSSLLALQSESGIPYNIIREEEKKKSNHNNSYTLSSSVSSEVHEISQKGFESAVLAGEWHLVLKHYLDKTLIPQELKASVYELILEEMLELHGLYHPAQTLFRNAPIFQYLKENMNQRYSRVEKRLREFDAIKVEEKKQSEVGWARLEKYFHDRRASLLQELLSHISFTSLPRHPQKTFLVQLLLQHKMREIEGQEIVEEEKNNKEMESKEGAKERKSSHKGSRHRGEHSTPVHEPGGDKGGLSSTSHHVSRKHDRQHKEEVDYTHKKERKEKEENTERVHHAIPPLFSLPTYPVPPPSLSKAFLPSSFSSSFSSSTTASLGPERIEQLFAYEGEQAASHCCTAFHTSLHQGPILFSTPVNQHTSRTPLSDVPPSSTACSRGGGSNDGSASGVSSSNSAIAATAVTKEVVLVGRVDGAVDVLDVPQGRRCLSIPHATASGVLSMVVERLLRGHLTRGTASALKGAAGCARGVPVGWVAVGYRDGWAKVYDMRGPCGIVQAFPDVHRLGVTCLAFAGPPLLLEEMEDEGDVESRVHTSAFPSPGVTTMRSTSTSSRRRWARPSFTTFSSHASISVFHHSWLLSGSFDGSIKVLDIFHGSVLSSIPDGHRSAPVTALCSLLFIRPEKANEIPACKHGGPPYSARFLINEEENMALEPRSGYDHPWSSGSREKESGVGYLLGGEQKEEKEDEEKRRYWEEGVENDWEGGACECGEDGPSPWAMDGRAWLSAGDDGRLVCWFVSCVKYHSSATRSCKVPPSRGQSSHLIASHDGKSHTFCFSTEKEAGSQTEEEGRERTGVRVVIEQVGTPSGLALRQLYDKFDGSEKSISRLCRLPQRSPLHSSDFSSSSSSMILQMTTEVIVSTSGADSKILLMRLRVAPHSEVQKERLCTEALCWFTNPMIGAGSLLYNIFPSVVFSLPSFPRMDTPILFLYAHSADGTVLWATVDMIWRNPQRWKEHVQQHYNMITASAAFSSMSRVLTNEVGEKVVKDLHFTGLTWKEKGNEQKIATDRRHNHGSITSDANRKNAEDDTEEINGFFVCSPSLPNAYVLLPDSS